MPVVLLVAAMLVPFFSEVAAQELQDTLKEVKIIRQRARTSSPDLRLREFSAGQKLVTLDSQVMEQYKLQSVAGLLAQQTPVFIKSYGMNGLATLNIRGSSAAQSQVFWNGIPINNAALGMADLSLLPVSMVNRLHLAYGSSAALWGSGNVGGALLLETDTPGFGGPARYELAAGAGSFGQYQAGARLRTGWRRLAFGTDVFAQRAENNFPYDDLYGQRQDTRNGQLRGLALQQQMALKAGSRDVVRLIGWLQHYEREIPAALFEAWSGKVRTDGALRVMADWNRKTRGGTLYGRAAFMADEMEYDDDTIGMHTRNRSDQYYAELGWRRAIGNRHKLLLFTPVQVSTMSSLSGGGRQERLAAVAAYTYNDQSGRLLVSASLREEYLNDRFIAMPGLGFSYRLARGLVVRASGQRTYRAPVLNELYYEPGGNKSLKPEQGWSGELGYRLERQTAAFGLVHDLTLFNRVIDDWIIWLGGSVWTPHNIARVHSRGLEAEQMGSLRLGLWRLHVGLNISYIKATTIDSYIPNDGSYGKQIPYSPQLNGQTNIGFSYRGLYFNYNQGYTGVRYVNMDESDPIKAYALAHIQLGYAFKLSNKSLVFSAQANNLFGERYEVVKSRPMPGLNWLVSVRLAGG